MAKKSSTRAALKIAAAMMFAPAAAEAAVIEPLKDLLIAPQQFALLADPRHGNMARKLFFVSDDFLDTVVASGRKKILVEMDVPQNEIFFNRIKNGTLTPCDYAIALTEAGYSFTDLSPKDDAIYALALAKFIKKAHDAGIEVLGYDFQGLTAQTIQAQDHFFACFQNAETVRQFQASLSLKDFAQYGYAAEWRERLEDNIFAMDKIQELAGADRAVVLPGGLHIAVDGANFGSLFGSNKAISYVAIDGLEEIEGYAKILTRAAHSMGLSMNHLPDGFYDFKNSKVYVHPPEEFVLANITGEWSGPACEPPAREAANATATFVAPMTASPK